MSARNWTRGPWRWKMNKEQTEGNVWGPNKEHIFASDLGGTFQYYGKAEWEEEIANHQLVAAAPELYEAGLALLEWISANIPPQSDALLKLSEAMSAALAKARGEL